MHVTITRPRCAGIFRSGPCRKEWANAVTTPFSWTCPRCGTLNTA